MDKRLTQLLKEFPEFFVTRTKRHYRVTNPVTGKFLITSSTPSGCRYERNVRADLRRLRKECGSQSLSMSTT